MNTSKQITKPPTEQEIEHALDVISRAAKARKASGQDRRKDRAFHKFWKQKRALAIKCDETAQALYPQIANALPKGYKELFSQYSLLLMAPCSITKDNLKMFQSIHRKAQKLLAVQGT
jgi:hypothetical protein